MRALVLVLPLAVVTTVYGQSVNRGFGSVVFPGGTSSTSPGISRNFGSVVFPGGTPRQSVYAGAPVTFVRPGVGAATPARAGTGQNSNFRRTPTTGRGIRIVPSFVYAYPVFVGGGYDNSYVPQEPAPQQQATPAMIQVGPEGDNTTMLERQPAPVYEAPRQGETVEQPEPAPESTHYLLAFKDHTIYSAVAYWADGDTLHYFTTGNVHNQASISLLDRDLTERLNRELGIDFKLPPAK